jgi:hypothetical protein
MKENLFFRPTKTSFVGVNPDKNANSTAFFVIIYDKII